MMMTLHAYLFQRGGTALIWAADEGHLEVARLLIENGAEVNHANNVSRQEAHSCFAVHMHDYGAFIDIMCACKTVIYMVTIGIDARKMLNTRSIICEWIPSSYFSDGIS